MAKEKPAPLVHKKINRTPVNIDSIFGFTPEKDYNVTGTFVNIECPGQPAKISGKYYKQMPYFSRLFMDGEKATIPLSVARWLNEECHVTQHTHILDDEGKHIKGEKKTPRYKFIVENY